MQVRIDEVRQSLGMVRWAEPRLDYGQHRVPMPPLRAGQYALGAVEGWRGEILYWIRTDASNRIARCKVKDPSLNNWPALVEAVQGDRKSTRLNSSHSQISYAVFCLKKKKRNIKS